MKKILRSLVLRALKGLAKRRIKNFKGKIICVTGSVGKTSTKDAIFTVLNAQFRVRRSQASMNSEFGLPLTILDIESGYSSAYKWSYLLLKALYHSFLRDHSDILLLELGVDKPGDMDYLLSLVKPDAAVFTGVAPLHLEEDQFVDEEAVFAEKRKLVDALSPDGLAVLNIDNPFVAKLAKERRRKSTITYGFDADARYRIGNLKMSLDDGLTFTVHDEEKKYHLVSGVLGDYNAQALTVALIFALQFNMEVATIEDAVKRFSLPPGRMTVIPAINEATMLDSSYNSSPLALFTALDTLRKVAGEARKVAVIGNMNELGAKSEQLHGEIGEILPKYADFLITVGKDARVVAEKAMEKGMPAENVMSFTYSPEAADWFKDKVKKGDVILVKGSQNRVRLEKFVKELMLNPEDADKLLVRQGKEWKNIN